ncbi:MAG: ATP-grasp domain-containing protein [Solirubrobacteraceae bacterium]
MAYASSPSAALPRPRVVWLGAAGTQTAFGLLTTIRRTWGSDVYIVAADINPRWLIPASTIADAYVQVPRADDEAFPDFLVDALTRHEVDTYIPIIDSEIVVAAALRAAGRLPREVLTLAPSAEVTVRCLDKLEMARWLDAEGFPSPETRLPAHAEWSSEGLVVKPRCGVGSVGVRVLTTPSELALLRDDESVVVQERCASPELTIDAFRTRGTGTGRAVCRQRIEVKAGVSTKARVFYDRELETLAMALGARLELTGAFCFQVMRSKDTESWMITDVNPRPGAGTTMSAAVGFDVLTATLADAWGLPEAPQLEVPAEDRYVARQYADYVL